MSPVPPPPWATLRKAVRLPLWAGWRLTAAQLPVALQFRLLTAYTRLSYRAPLSEQHQRGFAELQRTYRHKTTPQLAQIWRDHMSHLRRYQLTRRWLGRDDLGGFGQIRAVGLEHIDAARTKGGGALLLTTHLGYGRLLRAFLSERGYPTWNLGYKVPEPHDQVDDWQRLLLGALDDASDNDFAVHLNLRPVFRALANNDLVAIAVDGFGAAHFADVPFLGRPAVPYVTGPIRIAQHSGASVLPAFVVEHAPGWFEVRIEPPIALEGLDGSDQSVNAVMGDFAQLEERYVHEFPHLFKWERLIDMPPIEERRRDFLRQVDLAGAQVSQRHQSSGTGTS